MSRLMDDDARTLRLAADVISRRAPRPDTITVRVMQRFLRKLADKLMDMDRMIDRENRDEPR